MFVSLACLQRRYGRRYRSPPSSNGSSLRKRRTPPARRRSSKPSCNNNTTPRKVRVCVQTFCAACDGCRRCMLIRNNAYVLSDPLSVRSYTLKANQNGASPPAATARTAKGVFFAGPFPSFCAPCGTVNNTSIESHDESRNLMHHG